MLDPNFPTTVCRFDPAPLVTLIPAAERISLFASGKYAITPDVQAYAEASYNRNTTRIIIQPVPLSDQFTIPANNVAVRPGALQHGRAGVVRRRRSC